MSQMQKRKSVLPLSYRIHTYIFSLRLLGSFEAAYTQCTSTVVLRKEKKNKHKQISGRKQEVSCTYAAQFLFFFFGSYFASFFIATKQRQSCIDNTFAFPPSSNAPDVLIQVHNAPTKISVPVSAFFVIFLTLHLTTSRHNERECVRDFFFFAFQCK